MSEVPTPETQNAPAETDDPGSLDAAAAAFAAKQEPHTEANEEAEPDPESAEETQQEADEADLQPDIQDHQRRPPRAADPPWRVERARA